MGARRLAFTIRFFALVSLTAGSLDGLALSQGHSAAYASAGPPEPRTLTQAADLYRFTESQEAAYLGSGISMLALGLYLEARNPLPTTQELSHLDREDLPGLDQPYAGGWNTTARQQSDTVLALGLVAPVGVMLAVPRQQRALGLLYAEVLSLNFGAVVLAKASVARYRPYAYHRGLPLSLRLSAEAKNSFFSGHASSMTAGLVFATATYLEAYPQEALPTALLWSGALGLAAYGSWARVRAGMHFPTDIALGFIWGASLGFGLPWAHRAPGATGLVLSPFPSAGGFGLRLSLDLS